MTEVSNSTEKGMTTERIVLVGLFLSTPIVNISHSWTAACLLCAMGQHLLMSGPWKAEFTLLSRRVIGYTARILLNTTLALLLWHTLFAAISFFRTGTLKPIDVFIALDFCVALLARVLYVTPEAAQAAITQQPSAMSFHAQHKRLEHWEDPDPLWDFNTISRHMVKCIDSSGDLLNGPAALDLMRLYHQPHSTLRDVEGRTYVVTTGPTSNKETKVVAAVVFVTLIHNYDLLAASGDMLPLFVHLGINWLRQTFKWPSLFRTTLCLMGFQWPFRHGVFIAPIFRNQQSRILQEVISCLAQTTEVRLLVIPSHLDDSPTALTPETFKAAGVAVVDLAPSYRTPDMRKFHELPVDVRFQDYIRHTLKLQYRRNAAKNSRIFNESGHRLEIMSPEACTQEQCLEAARLCENIANKREQQGETGMLFKPTPGFIYSAVSSGSSMCSLMLAHDESKEIIASSILFRFPHSLMTSDIKGLLHEKARPSHAYFVMLAKVIQTALEEGYSFVDFGPTTGVPKMELGCTPIPMVGGLWASNPFIGLAMHYAGLHFATKVTAAAATTAASSGYQIQDNKREATAVEERKHSESVVKKQRKPKLTREEWQSLQKQQQQQAALP